MTIHVEPCPIQPGYYQIRIEDDPKVGRQVMMAMWTEAEALRQAESLRKQEAMR